MTGIAEQDGEESEAGSSAALNIKTREHQQQLATKREIEEKTKIVEKYKRIDQVTLTRVGLKEKQRLTETAISDVFNFTQLQRFRQNRNLLAFDKSKPIAVNPVASDSECSDSDDSDTGHNAVNTENQN